MRPIELKMTAFGSYVEEQIDFEAFGSDIYIITGDTGAGKTTIFDAIMFALYGTASGSNRKAEMMHCDHVPKSVDTVVTLKFEHAGQICTVMRKLHFRKQRGTDSYVEAPTVEADFKEGSKLPITGASKVTARIIEFLGLDADQFRKIVMLAQGEFRKFLDSNSSERNEILSSIFDSSPYLAFQLRICAAADKLSADMAQYNINKGYTVQKLELPEGLSAEALVLYKPEHPLIIENIDALCLSDEQEHGALSAAAEQKDAEYQAALKSYLEADGNNKTIEQYENALAEKLRLEAETERMEALRTETDRIKRAWRSVYPADAANTAAAGELSKLNGSITTHTEELEKKNSILAAAELLCLENEGLENEKKAAENNYALLEKELPKYDEYSTALSTLAVEKTAVRNAETACSNNAAAIESAANELARIEAELNALANIDAEAERAKTEHEKAETLVTKLDGKNGLREETAKLVDKENRLADMTAALVGHTEKAQKASSEYLALNAAFISGQAGVMARTLHKCISEDGKGTCPVCGTSFLAGDELNFAPLMADVPSEDEVKAAEAKKNTAERTLSDFSSKYAKESGSFNEGRDVLVRNAKDILGEDLTWELLSDGKYLAAKISEAKADRDSKKASMDELTAKQHRRDELRKNHESKLKAKTELEEKKTELNNNLTAAKLAFERADEAAKKLKDALSYESKSAANTKLSQYAAEANRLKKQIETADKAREKAQSEAAACSGMLESEKKRLPEVEEKEKRSAQALEAALAQNGFADMAEYKAVMNMLGKEDGEDRISLNEETLTDYDNKRRVNLELLEEYRKKAEGLEKADLSELEAKKNADEDEKKLLSDRCDKCRRRLENNRAVKNALDVLKTDNIKIEKAYRKIKPLATMASGATSGDGKISFENYVMGTMFRDVLNYANARLTIMSGGQYKLHHSMSAARANSQGGLEIEIEDAITNTRRKPGSFSGGETFLASMSLALGLADVVQNQAGGMSMDAIFIDEGFGSLSDDKLDLVRSILESLSHGSRQVAVISHVHKLEECISKKLIVKSTDHGSKITPQI